MSVSALHFIVFRHENNEKNLWHHKFSSYAGCCNLGVNVLLSDWCHSFAKRLKTYFTTCLISYLFLGIYIYRMKALLLYCLSHSGLD